MFHPSRPSQKNDVGDRCSADSAVQTPGIVEFSSVVYKYSGNRKQDGTEIGPLSLSIRSGERLALIGRNGSGKSTIINLLSSASSPSSGRVSWFGSQDPQLARARIGVVFQSPALDGLLTVRECLFVSGRLLKLPKTIIEFKINELAHLLAFEDRLEHRVCTLSGGLVRRVDLARALLHEPELLLLDEATSGLDDDSAQAFERMLEKLNQDGLTIVAATHTIDEVRRSDRVIALDGGLIAFDLSKEEQLDKFGGQVIRVSSAPSSIHGQLKGCGFDVSEVGDASGRIEDLNDEALGCVVRSVSCAGGTVAVGSTAIQDVLLTQKQSANKTLLNQD